MLSPILILGATRGVGLELARLLRKQEVPVTALVRRGSDGSELADIGVQQVTGDAMSPEDLNKALQAAGPGVQVVSTLSGRLPDGQWVEERGHELLAEAARAAQVRRLLLVTSIGCGDMAPYRSERAIAAFGAAVDAKTRGEDAVRDSGVPFTFIRPGGLRSEPATRNAVLTDDPQTHGMIHRADVALLVAEVLSREDTFGKAYAAVDPGLAWPA